MHDYTHPTCQHTPIQDATGAGSTNVTVHPVLLLTACSALPMACTALLCSEPTPNRQALKMRRRRRALTVSTNNCSCVLSCCMSMLLMACSALLFEPPCTHAP